MFLGGFLCFLLQSCLKVDSFSTPYAQEVYTCSSEIDFGVKGINSGAVPIAVLAFDSSAKGDMVQIAGLPTSNPFEIITKDSFNEIKRQIKETPGAELIVPRKFKDFDLAPTVAGIRARVLSPNKLEVVDFVTRSDLAEELNVKVRGTILKSGKWTFTSSDGPIEIYTTVGDLKKMFPKQVLQNFVRKADNSSLDELEDETEVGLYSVRFKCQALTYV